MDTEVPLASPVAAQTLRKAQASLDSAKATLARIQQLFSRGFIGGGACAAMDPAVLLADEPMGNIDTRSADEVFALLRRFNTEHGTTVLFVTHNAELAARCDKTIEVIDGRVRG